MAQQPLTNAVLAQTVALLKAHHGNIAQSAKASGVPRATFEARAHRADALGLVDLAALRSVKVQQSAQTAADAFTATGNEATVSRVTGERVKSLADLVRVCEIDISEWEVERFVCNKWETAAKVGPQDTATVAVTPLYQVKAWLKRKVGIMAARQEIAALLEDAKRRIVVRAPAVINRTASGHLLEPSIPDLHVGKLAWANETGWENYNSKIAERIFEDALSALLRRTASFQCERILFPIGNDLLHSDTKQGTTTAGTPLDNDSRYHKSFALVRRMMTRAIDTLRAVAPVHVIVVPGNHDTLSAWHLGDSLECYFHRCKDITIDNAPAMRKYYQWGKVMLMLTHGNRGKLADYPLVMAAEQPEMFGATVHREAHTGDKHQLKVQEHHGVRVRISPALCPPDAWHAEHHFVGNARSAEAFVWHREEGLVGTANYTVAPTKKDRAA